MGVIFYVYNNFYNQVNVPMDTQETQEKRDAPDFLVVDAEKNIIHLSDYLEKPVFINYWASWCNPCRMEMKQLNEAYSTYGDDVVFMMINMTFSEGETKESALAFVDENGYDFPIRFDINGNAAEALGVRGIPRSFFINRKGEIIHDHTGIISSTILDEKLQEIINEE